MSQQSLIIPNEKQIKRQLTHKTQATLATRTTHGTQTTHSPHHDKPTQFYTCQHNNIDFGKFSIQVMLAADK